MIKVVIVDDSPTARLALRGAFELDAGLLVVGEASTGTQAMQMVARLDPDIVTMDVYLSNEDGLDVARGIMASHPCPILVITGVDPSDASLGYRALQCGALDVAAKLPAPTHPDFVRRRAALTALVRALAQVPVVRGSRRAGALARPVVARPACAALRGGSGNPVAPAVLVIGASTGGPPVVCELLKAIRPPAPLGVVVVQHICAGFAIGFADWLASATGHRVVLVDEPRKIEPGVVYIAPDNRNVVVTEAVVLQPEDGTARYGLQPSIDALFESVAYQYGSRAVAVLLSGMGADGAQGLKTLADAGAVTVVQDPETCVVDSMPSTAIELGAATAVLSPRAIGELLVRTLADVARTQ